MKIKFNQPEAKPAKTKKPSERKDKMLARALEVPNLSAYQQKLLLDFTYFMVGHSKISPPAFDQLLVDFVKLVPDNQKTKQLEYVVENKRRTLIPEWFRDAKTRVTPTDNMGGKHTKSTNIDIDYSEGF